MCYSTWEAYQHTPLLFVFQSVFRIATVSNRALKNQYLGS